jgi:hypothetical protein
MLTSSDLFTVDSLPFHQHFWRHSRAAFAQIIFDAFNGRQNVAKSTKLWQLAQNSKPTLSSQI